MMKSQLSISAIILASLSSTVSGSHCNTLFTEFQRRQLAEFASEDPYTAADAGGEEKHVPFLTIDDSNTATIVVGNGDEEGGVWHPMVPSEDPNEVHWITHIMAVDQNNQTVAMSQLNADTDSYPSMTFQVPPGVTQLTPYSWCNIHGFWIGDTVVLDKVAADEGGAAADCAVSSFHPDTWPSLHADFTRLQNAVFLSDAPFDESNGEKHVPYITLTDDYSNGSIIVGNPEGEIHPMDGEAPHWITEIYVVDQTGTILDLTSLDPTNVDIATYEFDIPEKNANGDDVTSVKAYAWCNIHGLYEGPTVEVAAASSSSGNAAAGTSEAENSALNIARNGRKSVVLAGAAIVAGLNAL